VRVVTQIYSSKTMRNGCESFIAAVTQQFSWQTTQQNVPHGHNERRSLVFTGFHEFDRER
jgi:hypothetical protein